MKRILIVALVLLISIKIQSTTVPLDSVRVSLVSFLNKVEKRVDSFYTINELPDFLIYDRGKQKAINEEKEGVFVFGTLSSGVRTHFLLIDKDTFQILNMTDSIDTNVLKLIQFFERNKKQYSRDDILFYIKDLVITYQRNEEYIKSFNGIIK